MFNKILIFCGFLFIINTISSPENNYGKFGISISKFEVCKGPKSKNCCVWKYQLKNQTIMHMDIDVTENMPGLKGKIVLSTNNKVLFRLQFNKLCDHLQLRPMFESMFNLTKDCIILKGHYDVTVDIDKITQSFYDGSFLYGNLSFKSVFYNNQCNWSCSTIHTIFYPKKSD